MTRNYTLSRNNTALLVIDVQDKLVDHMDRACEVLHCMQQVIQGFQILHLPIVVVEQYPQGLGRTIASLAHCLGEKQSYLTKTTFSCLDDPDVRNSILALPITQWVLIGIEAHVCILQSAKGLLAADKQVVVLNDATTSRSVYDFSTAIAELRDSGVRVSSCETVLFELVSDSRAPEFKQISQLVK